MQISRTNPCVWEGNLGIKVSIAGEEHFEEETDLNPALNQYIEGEKH